MSSERSPSRLDRVIRWCGFWLFPAGALPGFGLVGLDGRDRSDPLVVVVTWLLVAWMVVAALVAALLLFRASCARYDER
jgi:hypothetical protein